MPEASPVQYLQKICRLWSRQREAQIAVRVYYELSEAGGCKIYSLRQYEELE